MHHKGKRRVPASRPHRSPTSSVGKPHSTRPVRSRIQTRVGGGQPHAEPRGSSHCSSNVTSISMPARVHSPLSGARGGNCDDQLWAGLGLAPIHQECILGDKDGTRLNRQAAQTPPQALGTGDPSKRTHRAAAPLPWTVWPEWTFGAFTLVLSFFINPIGASDQAWGAF